MSDDLIERLREMQENWKAAYLSFASLTFGEAADRIEAQAAEIDRLRVEAKAQFDRGYYDGCTRAALEARGLEIRSKNGG
jgi:hypothetical protein